MVKIRHQVVAKVDIILISEICWVNFNVFKFKSLGQKATIVMLTLQSLYSSFYSLSQKFIYYVSKGKQFTVQDLLAS